MRTIAHFISSFIRPSTSLTPFALPITPYRYVAQPDCCCNSSAGCGGGGLPLRRLLSRQNAIQWPGKTARQEYKRTGTDNAQPKPPHSFFWGHLKLVGEVTASLPPNCHPQVFMTEMARRYDLQGVWYLDLWPLSYPQVVLTEPELMDDVQVAQALSQHPLSETVLGSLVGKGSVATANGEPWKAAHKAIAPAFSNSHIRSLTGVMAEELTTFRGTLQKLAASGEVFSMEAELSKAVFDIIGRTVLNMPLNAQTTGSRYFDHVAELVEIAGESTSMNPLVHLRNYFRLLPLTKRLNGSLLEKIQERLTLFRTQKMVPSRKDPLSIMDLMLRETVIQDEVNAGEKKALDYISEDQLRPIQTKYATLVPSVIQHANLLQPQSPSTRRPRNHSGQSLRTPNPAAVSR